VSKNKSLGGETFRTISLEKHARAPRSILSKFATASSMKKDETNVHEKLRKLDAPTHFREVVERNSAFFKFLLCLEMSEISKISLLCYSFNVFIDKNKYKREG